MADELALVVDGRRYLGWKSIRVTGGMETIAGSFDLEVSDRWGDLKEPWPIAEEDPCRVEIAGQTVIDGHIDSRDLSHNGTTRTLSYAGRDLAAALVDSSLVVKTDGGKGAKWVYRNINVAKFVERIAAPHGIKVSVQPGLTLTVVPKLDAHPGESGFDAIKRAAGSSSVLVVSDGLGGLVITRSGTARATSLVEGQNIRGGAVRYDGSDRFYRYIVATQAPGTDDASGEACHIQAEAFDLGVRRKSRTLMIRPDKGYNAADAKRRADWEARTRAARAETVTIGVLGWRQPSGALWRPNEISRVRAPTMLGVDGDLVISQVQYTISEAGQLTELRLVRPDAFEPEPQATVSDPVGAWKELAHGGKP